MSYLPRMSKTYKEPQLPVPDDFEDNLSPTTLKPASSLLNEKTYNPQMALKHYKYLPHAPPVLPGPSVLEEALENELFQEAGRARRSSSKMDTLTKASESLTAPLSVEARSTVTTEDSDSKLDVSEKVKRAHSRKGVKGNKSSLGKKRSSKTVKKDQSSNITVNVCLTATEKPFTASVIERQSGSMTADAELLSTGEMQLLKREKSTLPMSTGNTFLTAKQPIREKPAEKPKDNKTDFTNRSVQCTIFGSFSPTFVIPPIINSLLRTLTFLLHEINKEEALNGSSGEGKFSLTQNQLLLGDLCNQKVDKYYGFDVTYSDFKRLEKIFGEFKKYMKEVYGDKGEYIDKMEDLKRVFTESKRKDMELAILNEKIQEREENDEDLDVVVTEEDLKQPEITLQNKRLESEQLTAEVEFSSRELKKYQKTIAEIEWDIKNYQDQMTSLKKSSGGSKSKTEVVGRKTSVHKFPNEVLARGGKNKGIDNSCKKKP